MTHTRVISKRLPKNFNNKNIQISLSFNRVKKTGKRTRKDTIFTKNFREKNIKSAIKYSFSILQILI